MLVLSRKRNEQVMIGDSVVVTIVEIRGDKVRLGIEAPRETPVHRREVYEAIHRAETHRAETHRAETHRAETHRAETESSTISRDEVR